jgi:mannose/fructose/N-acetylgalactosamine-specific phosphotransferase system component IIC
MEITYIYMVIGFTLAAYSVVANDSVQTLGTFIASNSENSQILISDLNTDQKEQPIAT